MKPAHTVIYTHGGGRLGNQVIRAAHWIAWVLSHQGKVEVMNLGMWPFSHLFSEWQDHPGVITPGRDGVADKFAHFRKRVPRRLLARVENRLLWQRATHAAGRVIPRWQAIALDDAKGEKIDLAAVSFFHLITQKSTTTCSGWQFASWPLFRRFENELRELFKPASQYLRQAEQFIASVRADHDVVVGIFIRQTDYRQWLAGRFCLSTSVYAQRMREMLDLNLGQRVGFVVASDERQDVNALAGLPYQFSNGSVNSGGHWFQSWVELSLCDLIVTPPSTFSATAAFRGSLALWPLIAADQVMACDQIIKDGIVGASQHPEFSLSVK